MWVGSQRHAPAALSPGRTRYPLYRRLGGPKGGSGRMRKILPLMGFDPRTVQLVASCYTDWATLPIQEPHNTVICRLRHVSNGAEIAQIHWVVYRLDSPGFDPRQRQYILLFSKTSRPLMGPTQPHIQRVPRFIPGVGGGERPGIEVGTTDIHQSPRLRMCGAIPPFPLYDVMPWTEISLPYFTS